MYRCGYRNGFLGAGTTVAFALAFSSFQHAHTCRAAFLAKNNEKQTNCFFIGLPMAG